MSLVYWCIFKILPGNIVESLSFICCCLELPSQQTLKEIQIVSMFGRLLVYNKIKMNAKINIKAYTD